MVDSWKLGPCGFTLRHKPKNCCLHVIILVPNSWANWWKRNPHKMKTQLLGLNSAFVILVLLFFNLRNWMGAIFWDLKRVWKEGKGGCKLLFFFTFVFHSSFLWLFIHCCTFDFKQVGTMKGSSQSIPQVLDDGNNMEDHEQPNSFVKKLVLY